MKIMVFLHGTTIVHPSGAGKSREERVCQVVIGDRTVRDYAAYVPIGNAVKTLRGWAEQGAEILYLSSHRDPSNVEKDRQVLERFGFPPGPALFRGAGETYGDVAERAAPDVLIEDDCESIGGEEEMVYPHMKPEMRGRVRSIVVREFEGIDHLPERASELLLQHRAERGTSVVSLIAPVDVESTSPA